MKALRYRASIPAYLLSRLFKKSYPTALLPLSLVDIPEPEPPAGWKRIKMKMCGICGSDLALLYGKNSPRLSGFFSFPAVLGHEILGEVEGQRVAVNPNLACRERGLEPCPACQRGEEHLCLNLAEGSFSPGMLGFCRDLPGGWAETIVAHPGQIHAVPDGIPDERAVLAETLAVAFRGLRNLDLEYDDSVLVIGAGSIGLVTTRLLRVLGYKGKIVLSTHYPCQEKLAIELGADRVFSNTWDAARKMGALSYPSIIGPEGWRGGFDVVIDAAGSATSVEQASWVAKEGGKILLFGSPGEGRFNFAPYWFREVRLFGTYIYTSKDFKKAVSLLSRATGIEKLVTHSYHLWEWKKAISTSIHRRGIKVVFSNAPFYPGG